MSVGAWSSVSESPPSFKPLFRPNRYAASSERTVPARSPWQLSLVLQVRVAPMLRLRYPARCSRRGQLLSHLWPSCSPRQTWSSSSESFGFGRRPIFLRAHRKGLTLSHDILL